MEPIVERGCGCGYAAEKPTQILSDEHRVIERVLNALEGLTRRAVGENLADWKKALDFFRHFADECHHFKEEQVLFPAMEEHGIPREGGPIGMMLMEHEEGRGYVRGMRAAIARVESKDAAATGALLENARAYGRLLREHIQKEDEILFPMAERVIPAAEQNDLLANFAQHEAKEIGTGTHERYLKMASELERGAR